MLLLCWSAGSHVLDEAERSLHDALCVLQQTVQDSRVIYGGGFPEMQMAKVLPFVSVTLLTAQQPQQRASSPNKPRIYRCADMQQVMQPV